MRRITLIHPSRGRPGKSKETVRKWIHSARKTPDFIISVDDDDPSLPDYKNAYNMMALVSKNRSVVDAVNNAAKHALGDVLMVVSDDTDCFENWDEIISKQIEDKHDFVMKTKDGIQDYIITNPIMDRAYYNRTGYIYHPEFQHLFCDTYLTCVADITGRKITSNLMFKHDHYSVNGTEPDDLHKRNDATWKQGQETFIRLMKQFTPQERARIKDPGMRSWLRNHGV